MNHTVRTDDTSVHVGEDGWLFLVHGEQRVIDLYREESAFTDTLARAWVERLRERRDRLQARGVRYVHMPVPDKLTLLHRHFGAAEAAAGLDDAASAGAPTTALENPAGSPLLQLAARYDWDTPSLLNTVPYLSANIDNYPVYWKSDTHWTCWGCFLAYQLLCSHLGVSVNQKLLTYPFEETERVMDLGARLDPAPTERVRRYRLDRDSRRVYASPLVRHVESLHLEDDQILHPGAHVIYRNDAPDADPRTVVLFGDSYADHRNHLLTGMLAETVREVHFVHAVSLDDEYLRRVRPDVVVSVQAERTMLEVPDDQLDIVALGRARLAEYRAALAAGTSRGGATPTVAVEQRTVLPSERYPLTPPITVQEGCEIDRVEPEAVSLPGDVVRVARARLYFDGVRCLATAPDGSDIRRYEVDEARAARVADEQYRSLSGTTLLLADTPGAHCYYHWMLDVLPKFALLERAGIALDSIDRFVVRELTGAFQTETLARFGIERDRIVESVRDQYLAPESLLHVRLDSGANLRMHRQVPAWLKHAFPHERSHEPRLKLYVSRPEGVRRGVANEAELRPVLERYGFEVLAMEGLSVQQQVQLMARVDVLVSPHGGALTNMVFCRPGARVLELLGQHVYPYYFGLAAACGQEYHALLERPDEDYARLVNFEAMAAYAAADIQATTAESSFAVDPVMFERALERLLA